MGYSRKEIAYRNWLIRVSIVCAISFVVNGYLYTQLYTQQYGISDLEGQVADLQNQISTLQNEVDSLKASKLITRLGDSDQRPWSQTPYVRIMGSVWNVGTNPAYNCTLHVILYQGQTVAKDAYINLGTINGEAFADLDSRISYEGSALTSWSITPEWE